MKRLIFMSIILGSSLLIGLGVWLSMPQPAKAQCSTPSSCKTCHEVQGQKSVNFSGEWHAQHAFVDFCSECHGGNRRSMDKAAAHTSMATKLAAMSPNCVSCHEDDFEKRFAVYSGPLGVSDPNVLSQARQIAAQNSSDKPAFLPLDPLALPLPSGLKPKTTPVPVTAPPTPVSAKDAVNSGLAIGLMVLVSSGGSYVLWNENRRRSRSAQINGYLSWAWSRLRSPSWSPYSAGILLGFAAILSVLGAHHLLSASGGTAAITSTAASAIFPDFVRKSVYFRYRIPPGLFTWEVLLLAGMFLGGMLAALSSSTFRFRWNDDQGWVKIFGAQKWKRFVIGFFGAMVIQYGASIAGGCTSGLAISGGMLLAPSAFLFMAGMFASGILVALLVYRKNY